MLGKLKCIAEEIGATQAQLCLAWAMKNNDIDTVIAGASSIAQARENLGAIDLLGKLDEGVLKKIEECLGNRPTPQIDWRISSQRPARR